MMPRMTNHQPPTTIERLLDSIAEQLSPEAAREFAELHAPDDVLARLDALAEKITAEGELDPAERVEYDGILQIAHVITMIQSRINLPPELDPTPDAGPEQAPIAVSPISRAPRTLGAGRNLSKLAGLQAMLDDLDEDEGGESERGG